MKEKYVVARNQEEAAEIASQKLKIENNLDVGTPTNICYTNGSNPSKCIAPRIEKHEPFENHFQFSFNLTGTNTPGQVISYEYRKCTHSIEIVNAPVGSPITIRVVPVSTFDIQIDPDVFNIVKAHTPILLPSLPNPDPPRLAPKGIRFRNSLGIQIKMKIFLKSGTPFEKTLDKDEVERYSNDSEDTNWFAEFQILEAKCPHNSACSKYTNCKYKNQSNSFCYYHLIIQSMCYPIALRVDDLFNSQPVLQFIGLPWQPQNINITIVPDTP